LLRGLKCDVGVQSMSHRQVELLNEALAPSLTFSEQLQEFATLRAHNRPAAGFLREMHGGPKKKRRPEHAWGNRAPDAFQLQPVGSFLS
jgi:hypothetical protein